MKLRNKTIRMMADTIAGDNDYSFYRSGPQLISFFSEFGFDDTYGQGFPSRWAYADDKIRALLQEDRLLEFINYSLNEEHYFETQENKYETQDQIIEFWNKYLELDQLEILRDDHRFLLKDLTASKIIIRKEQLDTLSTVFMREQIEKCVKRNSIRAIMTEQLQTLVHWLRKCC